MHCFHTNLWQVPDLFSTLSTSDPHCRKLQLLFFPPLWSNSWNHRPFPFVVQVQVALKRQWMQYKTQWGQRRKDHCSMRSTSYTATSITEVPAFMYHHECNSEHLNGRHTEDSELVALKSGETYA